MTYAHPLKKKGVWVCVSERQTSGSTVCEYSCLLRKGSPDDAVHLFVEV